MIRKKEKKKTVIVYKVEFFSREVDCFASFWGNSCSETVWSQEGLALQSGARKMVLWIKRVFPQRPADC